MEVQLQELVDKIKKDGVEAAESKANEIIQSAEREAAAIVAKARAESERLLQQATADANRAEVAAESAIKQAARNLLIGFRSALADELDAMVRRETARAYDAELLRELIPPAVREWVKGVGTDDVAVLLSPADLAKLESGLLAALKGEVAKGLELRPVKGLSGGFRIGAKDGSAYYDFSAEAVASLFSAYLNPRVSEILKSAAKEL